MANYDIMIQSYEELLKKRPENGNAETMMLSLNAYKTLNNKSEDEICAIFGTGAFNHILKGYCKKAMENCKLEQKQIDAVMDQIKWLLDTCDIKQVL